MNPKNPQDQAIEKELQEKFYNDPAWKYIEKKILGYIEPLLDLSTVDMALPAENVKVEIKGRLIAHETLTKFLNETGIISKEKRGNTKTTFK